MMAIYAWVQRWPPGIRTRENQRARIGSIGAAIKEERKGVSGTTAVIVHQEDEYFTSPKG